MPCELNMLRVAYWVAWPSSKVMLTVVLLPAATAGVVPVIRPNEPTNSRAEPATSNLRTAASPRRLKSTASAPQVDSPSPSTASVFTVPRKAYGRFEPRRVDCLLRRGGEVSCAECGVGSPAVDPSEQAGADRTAS